MMDMIATSQTGQAVITLAVVGVMFALFIREVFPTEVVAIGGAALLLALGVLPYDAGLAVLSNPSPWTIAMLFLVMGALVRTGALDALTTMADQQAKHRPRQVIVRLLACVIVGSAVINNPTVVAANPALFLKLARNVETWA